MEWFWNCWINSLVCSTINCKTRKRKGREWGYTLRGETAGVTWGYRGLSGQWNPVSKKNQEELKPERSSWQQCGPCEQTDFFLRSLLDKEGILKTDWTCGDVMKYLISLILGMIAVLWFFLQDFWYFKDVCENAYTQMVWQRSQWDRRKNPEGKSGTKQRSQEFTIIEIRCLCSVIPYLGSTL